MQASDQGDRAAMVAKELVRALDELELVANELALLARLVTDGGEIDPERARSALVPLRQARRHAEATLQAIQDLADVLVDELAGRSRWLVAIPPPAVGRGKN